MVWSVSVNGQADQKAVLVDQFGVVSSGDMRARFDVLLAELSRNTDSTGIVYSHGTSEQIAGRTRFFTSQMIFRGFDPTRIEFRRGRNLGVVRSDFWIIPAGAEPPEIKPEAWIGSEFGLVSVTVGKRRIASFFTDEKRACANQVYIVNYGTSKQIAQRESWLRNTRMACGLDAPRVTVVNGGPGRVRTVMWLVPPGAENPKP